MGYSKYYISILVFLVFACIDKESDKQAIDQKIEFLLGQWYTKDARSPHWIKFDSLSNYYRWSFDEQEPTIPSARYSLKDSLIYFEYPEKKGLSDQQEGVGVPLLIDSINPTSFRILPIEGEMPIYIYERDTFNGPQYVDVFFFYLSKEEVDSLYASGDKNVKEQYESVLRKLEEISLGLEYSLANTSFLDSRFIKTRDSILYDKFDYGGFGVIYYRNDSTYVRSGVPSKEVFFQEAESFFPISIK